MKLNDKLNSLNSYPFHMPGHKRNNDYNIIGSEIDITEIDGFDNLHNPKDLLLELEESISELFKSKKSIISVNGSTCCILSAICGVCNRGDKIIIARNCHKSVYNGCMINGLKVVYIEPEFDEEFGVYTRVTQESVDIALAENPDAKALVITSPTYEGIVSEINTDIPLIIDSAHGSHFGFAQYLPKRAKGDIVINSLHKNLPCLTQCAVIHINNEKYINPVKKYMDIFETSSPSYVLLSSIDRCVDILKESELYFNHYKYIIDYFYSEIIKHDNIKLLQNDDKTRIILSSDGYSGADLAGIMRKNGIEPEGYGINYVILISTVCDSKEGFDLLINTLNSLEKRVPLQLKLDKPQIPEKAFEQYEVIDTEICELKNSIGKISGESVFAYPPDIPLITAGEKISENTVKYITKLIESGINILSDSDLLPTSILTKKD